MRNKKLYIFLGILLLLVSCSTTKFVPENQYLLNKVTINSDNKSIATGNLESYVQQTPNSNFLFFKKMSLRVYSLSGRDTTKWRNRFIRRLGDPPVIFSARAVNETERQLTQQVQNLGYLDAEVTSETSFDKRKASVTYNVRSNQPYIIRNFEIGITDTTILSLLNRPRIKRNINIQPNTRFIPEELDRNLQSLVNSMRNIGFYNLSIENFFFQADTSLAGNQVDVVLKIRDRWDNQEDSLRYNRAFNCYRINSVTIVSGYDQFDPESRYDFNQPDTIVYKGVDIIRGSRRFLRRDVLYYNNFIRPGNLYSDLALENTYSSLNSMGAVKQANVYFREVNRPDTFLLNAFITLAPSNIFFWQTGIEGTNSAGDLGVAGNITFQDKNLFNGSEIFRIRLNGGFEAITASNSELLSNNFFRYGVDLSLTIPRFLVPFIAKRIREQPNSQTVFTSGMNWQNRPEYNQRFFNIDWMYRWSAMRNRLTHTLNLYNINYIATPWMSGRFENYLNRPENAILRESYNGLFITRSSYSNVYTHFASPQNQQAVYTLRTSLDIAGTLPYLLSVATNNKQVDGTYQLYNIPFAQYFKVGVDYARFLQTDSRNIIALHAGVGIACPYLNSTLVPYEQRYFAGGPNSVRGWSTRTLGPGSYRSQGKNDFVNQNGDIRILLNAEYRLKTETFLEYAAFIDAGNVWTIRKYDHQPGGFFKWDSFWKEMGLSWGIGIRPNFGFILIRLDAGMKIYSPEPLNGRHWVITKPNFKRDFAYHFAIGYPF